MEGASYAIQSDRHPGDPRNTNGAVGDVVYVTSQPRKTPWYVRWYGAPQPELTGRELSEQRFRALYPDSVWAAMTAAERAQARAAWDGQQQLVAATRESGAATRNMLLFVLVGIPLLALLVWGLIAVAGSVSSRQDSGAPAAGLQVVWTAPRT